MEQLVVATCCLCVCKITSGHAVFNADVEKEIECRSHREEPVRFYCDDCDTCVCVLCTFHAHRGHRVLSFHDAAARQVPPIATAVAWSLCLRVLPRGCHAPRAAYCYAYACVADVVCVSVCSSTTLQHARCGPLLQQ